MVTFACAISVATTCTFALVLPTAPPLAVAEELGIEIGIFFFYALVSAFVGMIVGGIVYGGFINKQDQKNKHFYTFDDLDEEIDQSINQESEVFENMLPQEKA